MLGDFESSEEALLYEKKMILEYSKSCELTNTRAGGQKGRSKNPNKLTKIRHTKKELTQMHFDNIDNVRKMMPINTKFKTTYVMDAAEETEYIVNEYWKHTGLDRRTRSKQAIAEALEQLLNEGKKTFTVVELANVSGISRNTILSIIDK